MVFNATFNNTSVILWQSVLLVEETGVLEGPSWSLSLGRWIYNYLCNQCLSPLKLWVRIPLGRGVLDTILCDKVCQWLVTARWFFLGTPVSSTNKTDCHNITEVLLKVAEFALFTIIILLYIWCLLLQCNCLRVLIQSWNLGAPTHTIRTWLIPNNNK
jgi:hypothetical protein